MSPSLPIAGKRFPSLGTGPLGRRLTYFDSACTTPAPAEVARAVADFYAAPPGCPLRSNNDASKRLTAVIGDARDALRRFVNARFSNEIVFTANTTMGINLVASMLADRPGAVLISDAEHNSNRLPWLHEPELLELPWPPGTPFPLDDYRALLRRGVVKLVSLASVSNVTGGVLPVREVVEEARAAGALVHIDAAQQAPHRSIDITDDRPDFLSFSLHKAYGPSGLGVLYVRRDLQATLTPRLAGGGSVDDHHDREVVPSAGPARFEFGIQNYAAIHAVQATVAFLEPVSHAAVCTHFHALQEHCWGLLHEVPGIRFIGPAPGGSAPSSGHVCNFTIDGVDSLRLAELLDMVGRVQVRAGRHCAHHYYHRYALPPSVRVSFGYSSTREEVEHLAHTLRVILQRYL